MVMQYDFLRKFSNFRIMTPNFGKKFLSFNVEFSDPKIGNAISRERSLIDDF